MNSPLNIFNRPVITLIVLFSVIALAIDLFFVEFVIMKSELSNEAKVNRLITSNDLQEVPVFGSSKARSAFIPDSLGRHVYNYGMEKCGFDIVNFLLEIELQKPKSSPVIIEYNHRSFISAPEHTINVSTYVPNLNHEEVYAFMERNDRLETRYFIPGLRYFGSYFYYFRYYFKSTAGNQKKVSRGGNFAEFTLEEAQFSTLVANRLEMIEKRNTLERAKNDVKKAISAGGRSELKSLRQYLEFSYDSTLVASFESLVKAHPEREIILVYTPQHWSETQGIQNLDEMQDFYQRLEAELPHLKVVDLSRLPLPDTAFKNTSHLNASGARVFSAALNKLLELDSQANEASY